MKKFFLGLAMLSMTALLFTACNKDEKKVEDAVPAGEESSVVEPVKADESAAETKEEAAVEVEAEAVVE